MSNEKFDVRESFSNPELLRSIGAAWRLFFFLLLQVEITSKSYTTRPHILAEALGVSITTFTAWLHRLQTLNILAVKSVEDKVKISFRPPFNKIMLVTEEGLELEKDQKSKEAIFDESTTDAILRRRAFSMKKVHEDIEFILNKLLSLELRLNALEGSYQQHHRSQSAEK
ncbi:hypothetical protein ACFL27_11325 [candidate division CSSED10-310 bacterium]|uniref:HTH marR-type domain-containing protein n=1 Tax=candidate division CSSED10-310 bacterium TaxID=2855610 RepID=A0ABV6YX46_UNCC1